MKQYRLLATPLTVGLLLLAGCPTPNTPPVADAGPDQTVNVGATVTLDGTGSRDADGNGLTYQWQFTTRPEGSQAVLSGAGSPTPRFDADRPGTFALQLTVYDEMSSSAPDTVTITVTGSLVMVPDLSGMTEAEAGAALEADGLEIGGVTMESSPTVPAGQVIRQDPAAGAEVTPGTGVDLVISAGPAQVTIPDLVGLSREAAESSLDARGLTTADVTFEHSDTIAAGNVIATDPAAGTRVDEGSAVALVISLGPAENNQVAVPEVAGESRAAAEAAIENANLVVGAVTFENSDTVAAGNVISSNPGGGSIVDTGSTVDLVVSQGPASGEMVEVPDLTGLTQTEAATILDDAGLALGNVSEAPSDATAAGTVFEQDPAAGAMANEGSSVSITLALAPIDIQAGASVVLREAVADIGENNVLRPDALAVDSTTGEIYIAARLTPHIAVYDTAVASITNTLETNFVLPGEKRLFLAPGGEALYIYDFATAVLARMERATGTVTANVPLDDSFVDLVPDPDQNRLYILRRNDPSFLMLNATTLAEEGTSAELDGETGDMVLDSTGEQLLILDTEVAASDGELRVYNPATDSVSNTITFNMPGSGERFARRLAYDGTGNRFFVLTDSAIGVYGVDDPDGSETRIINLATSLSGVDLTFDPASGHLVALVHETISLSSVLPRGASIQTYNPDLGQSTAPIETRPVGEINGHIALDTGTSTLLSTDSGTGTVWTLGTDPVPANAAMFELGLNIDQLIVAGDRVVGASRFGNSTLFYLTPGDGTISTFQAGTWPAPLAVNPGAGSNPSLTVVNAWDSTVARFTTAATPTQQAIFDTGFTAGTTERLPDVAISPSGNQLAVAYPEFGQVAVLNAVDGSAVTTIDVPNFDGGAMPAGRGQLQVLYDQQGAGFIYVLNAIDAVLHRYDTAGNFESPSTANLGGPLPDMSDAPETGWLFHDVSNNILFVGPVGVDPQDGTTVLDVLPDTQVVLASDDVFGLYWTVEQQATETGFAVVVRTVSHGDLTLATPELVLPGNHPLAPVFAFDTDNRAFHVGYPDTTTITSYTY